jgi:hypothetical protein
MITEANAKDAMEDALWKFIDVAGAFPRVKPDERIWGHVMAYMPIEKRAEIMKLWGAA